MGWDRRGGKGKREDGGKEKEGRVPKVTTSKKILDPPLVVCT